MMKPRPKAAPIRPNPWVRVFSVVLSVMAAWAVAILAPEMPSMMRDRNRIGKLLASAQKNEADQGSDLADDEDGFTAVSIRKAA